MTTERTCAERLPEHLAGRLADFRALVARDDPDEGDDELGPISEYGLGSSVRYAVRVDLSTGGPADYVEAIIGTDGDVDHITYHFADWFDHAEQPLSYDDFKTAEAWLGALFDLSSLGEYLDSDR